MKPPIPRSLSAQDPKSFPEVSVCRIAMPAQSSLSQRLSHIQENKSTNAGNRSLSSISLDEMDNFVVMFGERNRNRRFIDVWESDQEWISFVVKRYESSQKAAHKELMHYVNLKVERAELKQEPLPPQNRRDEQELVSSEMPGTRSKAMARPPTTASNRPLGPLDVDLESTWSDADVVEAPPPQLATMEHRLMHLENVMTRICVHLDQNTNPNAANGSYTGTADPNAPAGYST